MNKQQNKIEPLWIGEAEAANMLGLEPHSVRRNVITDRKLDIGYTRATNKSEPRYNKVDIDRILLERAVLV